MKITLHPLFFAAGIASALVGGLPVFLICVLTALLHECGHIFCARRMGFECRGVKLMPYGASAFFELDGISALDELKLALAGPLVNLLICVGFAGLWWFVPDTYAFTDTVFYASAAMLFINLLPAYPLDGGRAAGCLFRKFLKEKTADITLRVLCALTAAGLVALYFTALKNLSLLIVAAFLFCSVFEKKRRALKIVSYPKKKKRGAEIRYVVLGENATYKDALKFLDGGKFLVIQLYGDVFLDEITEDELIDKLQTHSIYDKIADGQNSIDPYILPK